MTTSSRCSKSSSNRCRTIPNRTPDSVIERAIWPLRTAVGRDGRVRIGTSDLSELAEEYGTPLYVYDAETIRASLREYVDAFFRYRPVRVAYSVKACALIGVGAVIAREGVDASVASWGELEAARRAGFPVSRMELHGNAKPDDEVDAALRARVGRFVVDGAHDIERLARFTHGRRRPQAVWLRVAPGIQVETHPHLATGTIDSKFGAPISTGEALAQAREIARAKGLVLVGRAGVALYRVVGTKRVPDVRTFVAVDGGMGDNIRPALYGAEYSAVLAARANDPATDEVTVAGRYCESGDVLIRSVRLPTAH